MRLGVVRPDLQRLPVACGRLFQLLLGLEDGPQIDMGFCGIWLDL